MTLLHNYSPENQSADHQSGFTLVEMLVALFIFAVISVGTLSSLQSAVQAKEATAVAVALIRLASLSAPIFGACVMLLKKAGLFAAHWRMKTRRR